MAAQAALLEAVACEAPLTWSTVTSIGCIAESISGVTHAKNNLCVKQQDQSRNSCGYKLEPESCQLVIKQRECRDYRLCGDWTGDDGYRQNLSLKGKASQGAFHNTREA